MLLIPIKSFMNEFNTNLIKLTQKESAEFKELFGYPTAYTSYFEFNITYTFMFF